MVVLDGVSATASTTSALVAVVVVGMVCLTAIALQYIGPKLIGGHWV